MTTPTTTAPHKMGPSRVNHGLSECIYCHATDREIHFALGPVCPNAPKAEIPATTTGPLRWIVNPFIAQVEDVDGPVCQLLWPTDIRSEETTFQYAEMIASAPTLAARCAEITKALEDVLNTSGARGEYHALKYADAVDRAEALLTPQAPVMDGDL